MAQSEQKRREKGVPGGRSKTRGPTFDVGFQSWWPLLLPAVLAIATYYGSLTGDFVFDDEPTVRDNTSLESIGGYWNAAFGKHSPISNRPAVALSFSLNYAVSGKNPFGYHVFNLILHVVNTLLLGGVVRRTLMAPNLGGRFTLPSATWTAAAIACIWAVHPLGTEAVIYITQRTTLMMSMFILLTLYGVLRSATEPESSGKWTALAVAACALGMLSKEEIVALPILVMLFDRAYLYESFAEARERRIGLYAALAGTWLLLILCVLLGPSNPTVGFKAVPRLDSIEWLMTEAPVLVQYVRLTLWPDPLIAAYDWPFVKLKEANPTIARSFSDIVGYGLIVIALLSVSAALWWRRPHWGWLGAMFFFLLAPTSSVMPIVTEAVAERRMYLPMLALLIPLTIGVIALGRTIGRSIMAGSQYPAAWLALPLAVLLFCEGRAARTHAATFQNTPTLWKYVYETNGLEQDLNNRSFSAGLILMGYGKVFCDPGEHRNIVRAIQLLERAVNCEAPTVDTMVNLAAAYVDYFGEQPQGQQDTKLLEKAYKLYQDAVATRTANPNAYGNFANLLVMIYQLSGDTGQPAFNQHLLKALEYTQLAIQLNPRAANFYVARANTLFLMGRHQEADQTMVQALQLEPGNLSALSNRTVMLVKMGRTADALSMLESLVAQNPRNPMLLQRLVQVYVDTGNKPGAIDSLRRILARDPQDGAAQALLQQLMQ